MPDRHRLVALASFALAGLTGLLAGCLPMLEDGGGGQSLTAGDRVIVAGVLVPAPYEIVADGHTVTVNGMPAVTFAPRGAPEPMVYDATSPELDMLQLTDLARRTYLDAGGGEAGVAAALDRIGTHPAGGTITAVDRDGITVLDVVDDDGNEASFATATPDADAREASEADLAAWASDTAMSLADHVDGGGGLVVSSAGSTQTFPSGTFRALLAATDAAFGLPDGERDDRLYALYADEVVVDDLAQNYAPRAPAGGAAAAPAGAGAVPGLAARPAGGAAGSAAGGTVVPGSDRAWILYTLYAADAQPFADALKKEGYVVRYYNFYSQDQPPGSALGAFQQTSRGGAVYFATHSSGEGLSVQSFAREADATAALERNQEAYDAGDISWWQEEDGTWWMRVTPQGIGKMWASNDTIVHSASCYSIQLAGAFQAREFFGYQPTTTCDIATPDTTRLWQRMTGEVGDGELREASTAFGAGGFSAGFRHEDGSPDGGTVLSPAVVRDDPSEPLQVGTSGSVVVGFDAVVDTTVDPRLVLTVEGCAEPAGDPNWQFDSLVTMPVTAVTPGTATVTVDATFLQAPSTIRLDGNQQNDTGVVPNRDDHVYEFTCIPDPNEPVVQVDEPTVCIEHGSGRSSIEWLFPLLVSGAAQVDQLEFTFRVYLSSSGREYEDITVRPSGPAFYALLTIFSYGSYPWEIVDVRHLGSPVRLEGVTDGEVRVSSSEQNVGDCAF